MYCKHLVNKLTNTTHHPPHTIRITHHTTHTKTSHSHHQPTAHPPPPTHYPGRKIRRSRRGTTASLVPTTPSTLTQGRAWNRPATLAPRGTHLAIHVHIRVHRVHTFIRVDASTYVRPFVSAACPPARRAVHESVNPPPPPTPPPRRQVHGTRGSVWVDSNIQTRVWRHRTR